MFSNAIAAVPQMLAKSTPFNLKTPSPDFSFFPGLISAGTGIEGLISGAVLIGVAISVLWGLANWLFGGERGVRKGTKKIGIAVAAVVVFFLFSPVLNEVGKFVTSHVH